jgi:hypothetical protein
MTQLYLQNLFEYLYDFIIKKGNAFLFSRLEREEYLKVGKPASIMRFVENASLEAKLLLCSKLGLRTALVMWEDENGKTRRVEDVFVGYVDVAADEMPRLLVKDHVFAAMDIDFVRALQYVSRASNSKYYSVNRKYLSVKSLSRKVNTRGLVDKLEAEANMEWYINTIHYALNIEAALEPYGINVNQFKILLYLHNCPNGAVGSSIRVKAGSSSHGGTGMAIKKLQLLNMVQYDPRNKAIVLLSTYGLMVLEKIISRFP